MRRVIGLTLAGLGAFLVAAALLVRTYVGGQLIKFPLNEYVKTILYAHNVSYFSPALVRNVRGATIRVTDTVKGDAKAGTSSVAVWNEFTYLYDVTNHKEYAVSTRRAAFDRRTAQLVDCCGDSVNGNSTIRQTGVSGYVFPMGTQKKTYQVYDTNLDRPMPTSYAGTTTLEGLTVYRFVEHVAPTQAGSQKVPGSLVGSSQSTVTLPEIYTATNTYWVDPQTGGVVFTTQNQKLTLADSSTGPQRLLLFQGDIVMSPASEAQAVHLDSTGRMELRWFRDLIPLLAGLIGLVALVTGILLAWFKRRGQLDQAGTKEPEPVLDPAL
jgi:hypothetical protein